MSTKHIISTVNVILALLVRFSIQLNFSQSETYQDLNEWSLETNLLEFNDDSNEQLLAFSEFQQHFHSFTTPIYFLYSFCFHFVSLFLYSPRPLRLNHLLTFEFVKNFHFLFICIHHFALDCIQSILKIFCCIFLTFVFVSFAFQIHVSFITAPKEWSVTLIRLMFPSASASVLAHFSISESNDSFAVVMDICTTIFVNCTAMLAGVSRKFPLVI